VKSFEIEQKYRIRNAARVRRLLKKLGARKIAAGAEQNEFFDRDGALSKKKTALRLRRFGKQATLTLKGPRLVSQFTKRMEIEAEVDYEPLKTILLLSGFRVFRSYTKKREAYKLGATLVTLDHLSKFGGFLEIEGRPQSIRRIEKKLGFSRADREERSYLQMMFGYPH